MDDGCVPVSEPMEFFMNYVTFKLHPPYRGVENQAFISCKGQVDCFSKVKS